MQTVYETAGAQVHSLADLMQELQTAAQLHSHALNIHYDRMLQEFDCLWMILRAKIELLRMPLGEIRIETWLRAPSSAVSIRDYAIYEGSEQIGSAIYSWALVNVKNRQIANMKKIPPVMSAPIRQPQCTEIPKRLRLPEELPQRGIWQIDPSEIDANGHVNNVCYIRHAEELFPDHLHLEVSYDRECFLGEHISLQGEDGFVRGIKEDGAECFRAKFGRVL